MEIFVVLIYGIICKMHEQLVLKKKTKKLKRTKSLVSKETVNRMS